MTRKQRLDLILLDRQLASTRTKAQELITAAKVLVNGGIALKPGEKFFESVQIELLEHEHPYVSRGGVKLAAAIERFNISLSEKSVLDVGISTGGFAHCALLHGARRVVGIEVGHGQLAPELAADQRVVLMERQDIRSLDPIKFTERFSRFVVDVSFISLKLVLPAITPFLENSGAEGIVLVKPQFELSRERIGSGGIVRSAALREEALSLVTEAATACGYRVGETILSPIPGGDGNQEFLLHLVWPS